MKVLNFGSLNIDFVYGVDHFVRRGETVSSRNMEMEELCREKHQRKLWHMQRRLRL